MEIKNQVQLAHVPKVLIQHLHKSLDQLQDDKFIIIFINDSDKVQGSISLVDDFVFVVGHEITHFAFAGNDKLINLCD